MRIRVQLQEILRIAGAVTYVLGGTATFASFTPRIPDFVIPIVFLALLLSSSFLFNRDILARVRGLSQQEHIAELDRKGLVSREFITSTRAIYFYDLATSCGVYLIDVSSKGLLCLYGQYLHEWSPIEDDEELNQSRQFPRTQFEVVRRLPHNEVLDLALWGEVYEPETLSPTGEQVSRLRRSFDDGVYIDGLTYEQARIALS